MKYQCTLLAVEDIDKSVEFYKEILGLEVIADFGANKTLTGGVALQTLATWSEFIETDNVVLGNNATELYFEEDNMDDFIEKLNIRQDIKYAHRVKEHSWGQRVVRIYDPDRHIIEIGENMKTVAKKFKKSGMTEEEIVVKMDISLKNLSNLLL